MKKLVLIALALMAFTANAQERKNHDKPNFTPEEVAELRTKQMTLDLDLTEAQQKQVGKINLEEATFRHQKRSAMKTGEASEKPSKEARLKMKHEMLDRQIELKAKMKQVLNESQYEKWVEKRESKKQRHMKRHKKDGTKKLQRKID
ncbi:hypothetical protein IA57_02020 [Mangrovimonas yunxiaonensis]|uniref:DUF4890 domain-containing protein n=1 Tax=Mangrovimonas yunxiaonensis TaxID=1197477 RepID=A0A084TNZ6_9FLAO|nr:hypothetical protein [Mangrovimonas yunxiaonensis]KFB02432.1 hypothetical protein IA57_02020 [Mangrovimonas yunxiaonensis]GGH40314.1 hypothetical protein GCM10011364_10320 [Mangrovimonas yunxiaonensis]